MTLRRSIKVAAASSDGNGPSLIDTPTAHVRSTITEADVLRRRVAMPSPLVVPKSKSMAPGSALAALMKGKKTDWERAKNAAKRIRDLTYSCKDFFDDVTAAFPELR